MLGYLIDLYHKGIIDFAAGITLLFWGGYIALCLTYLLSNCVYCFINDRKMKLAKGLVSLIADKIEPPSMWRGDAAIYLYSILLISCIPSIALTITLNLKVSAIIAVAIGVIYLARFAVRLKKSLTKHIDNKEAHK